MEDDTNTPLPNILDDIRSIPTSYPIDTCNSPMFSDSDTDDQDDTDYTSNDHTMPSITTTNIDDKDKPQSETTSTSQCSYYSLPCSNNFIPQESCSPTYQTQRQTTRTTQAQITSENDEDDPDFMPPSQQYYMAVKNKRRAATQEKRTRKRNHHKVSKPRGVEVTESQKASIEKEHQKYQKRMQATLPFFIEKKASQQVAKNKRGRPPFKPHSEFDSRANNEATTETSSVSSKPKRKSRATMNTPVSQSDKNEAMQLAASSALSLRRNTTTTPHTVDLTTSSTIAPYSYSSRQGPLYDPYNLHTSSTPSRYSDYYRRHIEMDYLSEPPERQRYRVVYNSTTNSSATTSSSSNKMMEVLLLTREEMDSMQRERISDQCREKGMDRTRPIGREQTTISIIDGKLSTARTDQRPVLVDEKTGNRKRYMFAADEMFPLEIFPLNTSGHVMLSNAKMLRLIPEDDIAYMMFHRFHMMVKGRNATNLYGISPVFDYLHDHYFLNLCLLKALLKNPNAYSATTSHTSPPSNLLESVQQATERFKLQLIPLREKLATATLTSWKSSGIICGCSDQLCVQHNARKPHLYVCNGTWYIDRGCNSSPQIYTQEEQRMSLEMYRDSIKRKEERETLITRKEKEHEIVSELEDINKELV